MARFECIFHASLRERALNEGRAAADEGRMGDACRLWQRGRFARASHEQGAALLGAGGEFTARRRAGEGAAKSWSWAGLGEVAVASHSGYRKQSRPWAGLREVGARRAPCVRLCVTEVKHDLLAVAGCRAAEGKGCPRVPPTAAC